MSSVSRPGVSSAMFAAISPVVYICAMPGESSRPFVGELLRRTVLLRDEHPVLLAGGVEVVAAGGEARLDDLRRRT